MHELVLRAEHKPNGWEDWASLEADSSKDPPLYCEIPGRDFEAHRDGITCLYCIFGFNFCLIVLDESLSLDLQCLLIHG